MKKFILIDRNKGCRPARDEAGRIKTVEAESYDDALTLANERPVPWDSLGHRYEVMEEAYIQECLQAGGFQLRRSPCDTSAEAEPVNRRAAIGDEGMAVVGGGFSEEEREVLL